MSVARARIERSARLKDGLCRNGYVGVVSGVMTYEPYEMRSRYENSPHTHLLLVGWWRCGRGAVEHELGRGAEAA